MLCEICVQFKKKCQIYKTHTAVESLTHCEKDKYEKAKLSAFTLAEVLNQYNERIKALEDIIGRPNLQF